jgi:hypothetical protein
MLAFQRSFGRRTARCSLGLRFLGRKRVEEVSREDDGSMAESERQDLVSNGFAEEPVKELATDE